MAWKSGDRVKETSTTTGTSDVTLAGAVSNFQAFSAICANGDLVAYAIVHQTLAEWEVGLGTWNAGNTLTRTRVLASSNAGAAVNFSAGTKDVFCSFPGAHGTLPLTSRVVSVDTLIPAGASLDSPYDLEIASGVTLEVAANGVLVIG